MDGPGAEMRKNTRKRVLSGFRTEFGQSCMWYICTEKWAPAQQQAIKGRIRAEIDRKRAEMRKNVRKRDFQDFTQDFGGKAVCGVCMYTEVGSFSAAATSMVNSAGAPQAPNCGPDPDHIEVDRAQVKQAHYTQTQPNKDSEALG